MDSETLVCCLRSKSEEEILAINEVERIVCLGGPGLYDMGVGPYYSKHITSVP